MTAPPDLPLEPSGDPSTSPDVGTVLVLPWGIHLTDDGAPCNAFVATVTHAVFQGRITRLRLHVAGEQIGPSGTGVGSGADLSLALDMGMRIPQVGEQVRGWLKPEALRWFPPSHTAMP
jgi:hypothetical protein